MKLDNFANSLGYRTIFVIVRAIRLIFVETSLLFQMPGSPEGIRPPHPGSPGGSRPTSPRAHLRNITNNEPKSPRSAKVL